MSAFTLSNIHLTSETRSFIQEPTAMAFSELFTKLKYCAVHVQSKTDRGWAEDESKADMPSYCSHPGVLLQGCFYRLVRVSGPTWNCNDRWWLKIKLALKQMGWDPVTSPAPLTTKKVTGRLCMLEQPTNMWQIHPDSWKIFLLLTSNWLTVFWASYLIFFPSQTDPYLSYSLDV